MSKPFQITLLPDAKAPTVKPGWHRRALVAAKRASYTARTVAPQRGDPRADAKAVDYALWLAARDGIAIPQANAFARVDWQPCAHGIRPRAVEWLPEAPAYRPAARAMAQPRVAPLVRIELPHWDYEAPAVIESTLLEWAAPVVIEIAASAPCEAEAPPVEPVAAEPCAPSPEPVAAPCSHLEPMALCPANGLPCRLSCGFRPGCGPAVDSALDAIEAEPLAPLCSDDDAPATSRPVTVLCLSQRSRAAVLSRTEGRAMPEAGHSAKGGAFRLSLADAETCSDIKSVRFIGRPRKAYTRRAPTPSRSNWTHSGKSEGISCRNDSRTFAATGRSTFDSPWGCTPSSTFPIYRSLAVETGKLVSVRTEMASTPRLAAFECIASS